MWRHIIFQDGGGALHCFRLSLNFFPRHLFFKQNFMQKMEVETQNQSRRSWQRLSRWWFLMALPQRNGLRLFIQSSFEILIVESWAKTKCNYLFKAVQVWLYFRYVLLHEAVNLRILTALVWTTVNSIISFAFQTITPRDLVSRLAAPGVSVGQAFGRWVYVGFT